MGASTGSVFGFSTISVGFTGSMGFSGLTSTCLGFAGFSTFTGFTVSSAGYVTFDSPVLRSIVSLYAGICFGFAFGISNTSFGLIPNFLSIASFNGTSILPSFTIFLIVCIPSGV